MKKKQIYTYDDVCMILNKSKTWLYYKIKSGLFPEPDIIINSRLKFYSHDLLSESLSKVFNIDLNKIESEEVSQNN